MIAAGGSIAILVLTLAIAGPDAPVPAATPSDLPEIGHTKATTPACAAMRDLVIPSFDAARRADARFAETQTRLPRYAEARADVKNDRNATGTDNQITEGLQESLLSRLDQDAANLLAYAAFINRALGDPRLAADSKDPDVQEERTQLQAVYAIQQARASMLAELAARDRVVLTRRQMAELKMPGKNAEPSVNEGPSPQPFETAAPGLPTFTGNAFADKERARAWTRDMARAVADAENRAAKSFLPLAQRCR
jgi:hypothetical protein